MAPSVPWCPGDADVPSQAAGTRAHDHAAVLRRTQLGQLQLRVRDRIARRTAAATPATPAAPAPACATPASLAAATRRSVERLLAAATGNLPPPPESGPGSPCVGAPTGDPAAGRPPAGVPANCAAPRLPRSSPSASPASLHNRSAAAKRLSAERLIAAILGKPPSPCGTRHDVALTGASSEDPDSPADHRLHAPTSAKRRCLPTLLPAAAPVLTGPARPRRPLATQARLHPALRRSSLPPNVLREEVPPGAPSPSCREIILAPMQDLDQRAAERERIARAGRRSVALAAPTRARWRPPSLRNTPPPAPTASGVCRPLSRPLPQLPTPVQLTAEVLAQLATPLPPPPPLADCRGLATDA